MAASAGTIAAARIYFTKVPVPETITIANVNYQVTTLAGTNTHGFIALYDSSGNMLVQSADLSTPWQSTGAKTAAVSQTVTGGRDTFIWVAFYTGTAGTPPAFKMCGNGGGGLINAGCGASVMRCADIAQVDTPTLPNVTPSGMGQNALPFAVVLT